VSGRVQHALDLCNGKRSLLDIQAAMSSYYKSPTQLDFLIKLLRYLQKSGKVGMRTVLQKKDVLAAIRSVGIKPGDLIVAHSSLSDFGYLEGGAEALVDCLLEAVGKEGTVCVPTHSLNWIGKPPYDPKTSPSLTGIIPQKFLRRPGVLRSLHPTHSVAAIGPLAARLLEGHDHRVAPQAREGFWGKLVEANGKVLMLCRLGSNTLLHGGELWAGTPYPPCQCHFLRNGERIECTVPGMPWHVHAFDHAHDRLRKRRRLFEAKLGESIIHSMYAREAVEEMMAVIRENPEVAISPKCKCYYCNYLREHLNGSTKSEARSSKEIEKAKY
jgi:aminoglycoside 3-N-acetyltransferase